MKANQTPSFAVLDLQIGATSKEAFDHANWSAVVAPPSRIVVKNLDMVSGFGRICTDKYSSENPRLPSPEGVEDGQRYEDQAFFRRVLGASTIVAKFSFKNNVTEGIHAIQ